MPAGEEPFVTVTHAEVWQELRQHESSTGTGGHADHEQRIRKLEWRYFAVLAGFLTGLTGAIALAMRAI